MDDELFEALYHIAWKLWPSRERRVQYAGRTIVLMYLWSVIRGKPRQWVCHRQNLPDAMTEADIPSSSQFGRRLRSARVQAMLTELENHLRGVPQATMLGCWLLDAKPLLVSPYSKDKSAKRGWAYNGRARGYKVFAMSDLQGRVVAWDARPMNEAEPLVARTLLQQTDRPGYVICDSI
ncbi:MAG TPA: hypothetical protein DCX07_05835 [Phycisphaerales bacterium]|nr:hypothetical protein [Phycisphaerales bacterium]